MTIAENILHDGSSMSKWTSLPLYAMKHEKRDALQRFEKIQKASLFAIAIEDAFLLVKVNEGILEDES